MAGSEELKVEKMAPAIAVLAKGDMLMLGISAGFEEVRPFGRF